MPLAKFFQIILSKSAILGLFLLVSCESEDAEIDVLGFDPTSDQVGDGDNNDQGNNDQTDNLDDILPSAVIATAIVNDAGTVPVDPLDFLPGINNPNDINAGLAEIFVQRGLAYDDSSQQLYALSDRSKAVYRVELDRDMVSWFAGRGDTGASDIFENIGLATAVLPQEIDLDPKGIALSGDYLYIANPGSIVKVPKDGSSLEITEVQFASGRGIAQDANDLDVNRVPQTKGSLLPDAINLGAINGLYADNDHVYVVDDQNSALRLISIALNGGQREVFNYYFNDPAMQYYVFNGPVVHDDGSIYSLTVSEDLSSNFFRRVMKFPSLSSLSGDDYAINPASSFFSGSGIGASVNGDANTAIFSNSVNAVSANSLLYFAENLDQSLRVVSDDGAVISLPFTYGSPSPADAFGDLYLGSMVHAGGNLFYALGGRNIVSLSMQFQ